MSAKAVMFDMDGLLLDTERVCLDSFLKARRHFSLPDCPEVFMSCIGLRAPEIQKIIRTSLDSHMDVEAFNLEWSKHLQAQLALEIPVKKGALQLVQILARKGTPMGVATSSQTPHARSHLERAGILPHLKCVVGGDLVKNGKPNPEVYHKVSGLLGAKAEDCIAFEDSETGTTAALASGAKTVQVPDLIPPTDGFSKNGQIIAPTLLDGAIETGLISPAELNGYY